MNLEQPTGRSLDLLLESLPVLTWMTDANLRLTWARGGALRTMGLDCLMPTGAAVSDIAGADHPVVAAHLAALSGEARSLDIEWLKRSYQAHVQPVRSETGTIVGCIGSAHDVTDLRSAERTIAWQSSVDPQTGVLNRKHFSESLEMLLLRSKHDGSEVTVLVIDIDDFGPLNEAIGTTTGDDVLRAVIARVSGVAPENALIGRVHGDEIAVVLPSSSAGAVHDLCDAIHIVLDEPFSAGNRELLLSVSIGAATFPVHARSSEQLLRCAKAATKRAHQAGGGRTQVFFPALTIEPVQRLELDHSLRRALDHEEFFLVYQPQIRLEDESVEGLEVLLRWRKDGDVLPAWSFIPRLEESPLMIPVGSWILDRAIAQWSSWRSQGLDPGRLAINVGARQLDEESFVATVRNALTRHAVPPQILEIEITETAAMQNAEATMRILEELHELGVGITIDDFGTGYSSLNYLKRFTITGLKIDRSFVADLHESRAGAAIVEAMIATAKALDLRLVAEGVEMAEQAEWLRNAGCPYAQGFLFSKPLTEQDAGDYLRQRGAAR